VQTVHDLIAQIDSGMRPREKKTQSKIIQGRIKELYDRFNNKKNQIESLLQEFSFFCALKINYKTPVKESDRIL